MSTRIGITFNLDWIAAFLCEWFRISRVRHVKHKTNEVSLRDDKIWRFLRRVRSGHKQPDVQAPNHRCSLTFHLRGLLYHRILEFAWKTSRYADIRFSPPVLVSERYPRSISNQSNLIENTCTVLFGISSRCDACRLSVYCDHCVPFFLIPVQVSALTETCEHLHMLMMEIFFLGSSANQSKKAMAHIRRKKTM